MNDTSSLPNSQGAADLEDQIYLQVDELSALRGLQSMIDANNGESPLGLRRNYSILLEEQALLLRKLLNQAVALRTRQLSKPTVFKNSPPPPLALFPAR